MPDVSISVPLVVGGKSVAGDVFLERTATQSVSRSGARFLSRQSLAPGDSLRLLLPEQDRCLAGHVTSAGPRRGDQQEFTMAVDADGAQFWSMLHVAALCVGKPVAPEPVEAQTSERMAEMVRETVDEALDRRLDHVLDDFEKRYATPAAGPTSTADQQVTALEVRMTETMERMWQELGRRFTTAGVTYEKRMDEVVQSKAAEFEARLAERLSIALKKASADFELHASFVAEKLQQRR
jgi:hypothetical protein